MKIYLDIDNTLIYRKGFDTKPAKYVKEFLTNAVNNHEVYWLTTHCNGDASIPVFYLSKILPEELLPLIMKIKPTSWDARKIDAVELEGEFLWFDDVLMDSAEKLLRSHGKLDSYVMVNLQDNPDFLKDYLDI